MEEVAVPLQAFGLGDIIFSQEIFRHWYKVTWGVLPEFLPGLKRAYPTINFVDHRKIPYPYSNWSYYRSKENHIIPLRWASEILGLPYKHCMRAKYDLFGLDYGTWRNTTFVRDVEREAALLEAVKKVNGGADVVCCRTYGSHSQFHSGAVPAGVEVQKIGDFSLFDWAAVLEQAKEIHTVSTSLLYVLELLDVKAEIHLYPRADDPHFKNIQDILNVAKHEYHLHSCRP